MCPEPGQLIIILYVSRGDNVPWYFLAIGDYPGLSYYMFKGDLGNIKLNLCMVRFLWKCFISMGYIDRGHTIRYRREQTGQHTLVYKRVWTPLIFSLPGELEAKGIVAGKLNETVFPSKKFVARKYTNHKTFLYSFTTIMRFYNS